MALLVIWSHSFALYFGSEASEPLSIVMAGTLNSGNMAVMVFFVISGFLVTRSLVSTGSIVEFMNRRVRRIYPGYIAATMVCILVVIPIFSHINNVTAYEAVKAFAANLLLRNYFPPSNVFPSNPLPHVVNGSLWSIPFEFWCYIGVVALGATGLLMRRWTLVAATIIVLIARVVFDVFEMRPGGGFVGAIIGWPYLWSKILPLFLFGVIAFAFRDVIPRRRFILFGLLGATVVSAHVSQHLESLILAPSLAYATFYCSFSRSIQLQGVSHFGDFSYGTYLYAFPIQQMIYSGWGRDMPFPAYVGLSVIFSVAAGILSWFLVERWFLSKRQPKPLTGCVVTA